MLSSQVRLLQLQSRTCGGQQRTEQSAPSPQTTFASIKKPQKTQNGTSSAACALAASVCEWLHTLPGPVRACLWRDVCIGSPLTRSSAVMRVRCGGGGSRPRVGLIGIKRAALKSHRRLEMLSETGNLLLGDFRQLLDSVCSIVSPNIPPS